MAWISKNQHILLWGMIVLVAAAMLLGILSKYNRLGYNAMDLGIYNQVFYNTVHGRFFEFSIHPHSYLGDHFELFIILLAPVYAMFQSPITLLILQILAVVIAAWPLYLIAKKFLSPQLSLLVSAAWLINPFLWNMAFFEFHMLPFAMPLLLFTYYYFLERKFLPFVIFSLISLTVREDVSLVIIMFGILALAERRPLKWVLSPIIAGGIWFIGSMQLTGFFNQYGSYKFLAMYPWLGDTFSAAAKTIMTKPWLIILHIINPKNLLLAFGLLLPLAGLPLIKPKTLLLTTIIMIQLFLSGFSPSVILETHYPALVLPFLFVAAIYGLAHLYQNTPDADRKKSFIFRYRWLYGVITGCALLYAFVIISPIATLVHSIFTPYADTIKINQEKEVVASTPSSEHVVAGYNFLTPLSNREHLYSLNYAFMAKKQYSNQVYRLPPGVERIVMDASDFITFQLQNSDKADYRLGAGRINDYISSFGLSLESVNHSIVTFSKQGDSHKKLFEYLDDLPSNVLMADQKIDQDITLIGWKKTASSGAKADEDTIDLTLYWKLSKPTEKDYDINFVERDRSGKILTDEIMPFGYGLAPMFNWPSDKIISTNFQLSISRDSNPFTISVVDVDGYLDLDGWRSAKKIFTKKEIIGPTIAL